MSTSRTSRRRRHQLSTGVLVLGLIAAACGADADDEEASVNRDEDATAETTLNVWYGSEPGHSDAITELIAEFDAANPDVSVEITAMGPELDPPSLLPALSAGEGPDLWEGGVGPGQPAAFIRAGHVLDLSPYYFDFGWDEVIPEELVMISSSEGNLWSVPNSVEPTTMFYRQSIFEEHGLSEPTDWDGFLAVLDTLQDAGYETVIGMGAGDVWPTSHLKSLLWGYYAGPDGVEDVMFGDGRWDDDPFVEATRTFNALSEAGYFGADVLAMAYQDVMAGFYRGEIPMTFTGAFVIPNMMNDAGDAVDDIGVFPVPNPVGPVYATESIGAGWYVNADVEDPDAAARLLDYVFFHEEGRAKQLASGRVPVGDIEVEAAGLPSIHEEILAANEQNRSNGLIPSFLDTVTPAGMTEAVYDGLQALLAGQMTPEQFNEAVQQAWEAEKAEGNVLLPGGVDD
jgi:raffinose/stachyose/melibiose transport system substrate-binding protein